MCNGIDQGEIISPLLWIIYYDPLFSKIKKENGIGYKMEHSWKNDLNTTRKQNLSIEIHNIAYMDDNTWLKNSKTILNVNLK